MAEDGFPSGADTGVHRRRFLLVSTDPAVGSDPEVGNKNGVSATDEGAEVNFVFWGKDT